MLSQTSNRRTLKLTTLLTLLALALLGMAPPLARAGNPNPRVLPPQSHPYGRTYGEWSEAWWQWALSIPVHSPAFSDTVNHPLVDLTGAKCGVGQSGPVWFLGGAFFQSGTPAASTIVRDNCTVPASKALFFPILNNECSTLEGTTWGCADTEAALPDVVRSQMDLATNLKADVDGQTIVISPAYRVGSATKPTFCFTLAPDDVLSFIGEGPFSAGTYCPTADDGYYIMLAPLPQGQHTIHVHGEIPDFNFTLDVTYHLIVQ